MYPFADFPFFGLLLLYVVLPTVVLGLFGRANWRWALFITLPALGVIFGTKPLDVYSEYLLAGGYAVYQTAITFLFLRFRNRWTFYTTVALTIAPLAVSKFFPLFSPEGMLGFLGISYVTFRALDVIFSIQDRVITSLNLAQYLGYLFFFPTISSGPIDRYRRFGQDWNRVRGRHEFLIDLDATVQRVFQGFLYKFIIAAVIKTYWMDKTGKHLGFLHTWSYMYAYTFYLFFDFAGYSAFAIGFSRLLGIKSPENFALPFLSRNIRDFWNRWHISLSFWFRDHVYMRFLLAAGKGKWFKGRHTASYLGLFLTFGIMGIWHGPERHYLLYGLYHATLLSAYDAFARWNKQAKFWPDGRWWRLGNMLLTFHAIAFGLLIFSGRFSPHPVPRYEGILEQADCAHVSGWAWDATKPNDPLNVDVYVDYAFVGRAVANQPRDEMREHGYGNGAHGFTFPLPPYVKDGRNHIIETKVFEGGRLMRNSPETVMCHE